MGQQFDELTKAFAQGHSRRRALRGFVTGLVGAAVGMLVPGGAQPVAGISGNSACLRFCLTLKGKDRERCLVVAQTCPSGHTCVYTSYGNIICL
jgi:hypothetical protein